MSDNYKSNNIEDENNKFSVSASLIKQVVSQIEHLEESKAEI